LPISSLGFFVYTIALNFFLNFFKTSTYLFQHLSLSLQNGMVSKPLIQYSKIKKSPQAYKRNENVFTYNYQHEVSPSKMGGGEQVSHPRVQDSKSKKLHKLTKEMAKCLHTTINIYQRQRTESKYQLRQL